MIDIRDIHVEKRELTGKKCEKLRREGLTPAVISGKNKDSVNIQLDSTSLSDVMLHLDSAKPFNLELNESTIPVIIKNVEMHPVHDYVVHIDFIAVDDKTPITVDVPVHLMGTSPAVKNNIGVLVHELDYIQITCLPLYIPDQINVDISNLKVIGDNVLVRDLELKEGLKVSDKEKERTIVTIAKAQKVIEEEEPTATAEGEEEEEAEGTDGETAEGAEPATANPEA